MSTTMLPLGFGGLLGGLKVQVNQYMTVNVWVFPKEPYFEYEPKDERWCRMLGIGHEEVRPSPDVYRMGDTLIMHPALWEQLKAEMDKRNAAQRSMLFMPLS